MSIKNRKATYDSLKAAGRDSEISERLKNEFGIKETPKIVQETTKKTTIKVVKSYKKGGK